MTLASFFSWADQFVSYLVGNTEDRFSRDKAQLKSSDKKYTLCYCKNRKNSDTPKML